MKKKVRTRKLEACDAKRMNKERVSLRPWHVWDLLSGAARNGGTARRSHDRGVEAAKLETYRKLGGGMNSN